MRAKPRPSRSALNAHPAPDPRAHSGGGHVGQLHELIESRFGTAALGPPKVLAGERLVQAVSRSVGWALLGGCYLAAAAAFLG